MRNFLSILSIFLVALCSCKKEQSPTNNNLNPQLSIPVILKRFVVVNPIQAAPNDTIGIIRYSYDILNRCIQIVSSDYSGNGMTNVYNYYNGSDTLIKKRKIVYDNSNDSTWEYFTYNANGMMLSDSLVHLPGATYDVYKYQISGGSVVSMISLNAYTFLKAVYTIDRDAVGNIISERDSAFQYNAVLGYYFHDTSLVTISYDNHPCPFYKLYPKRLVETDYENADVEDVPFYWAILQQNNILQEVRTTSPNALTPFNHSFTYQYNAQNYPIDVTFRDNQNGDILKGYYFY